jgi:protein SCO1
MTTRTYALIMTTLSIIGLVAMLVAMAALENDRKMRADQMSIEMQNPDEGLPKMGNVTDFELENQSGAMIKLANMKDKVWVVDFIFTSCAGICPIMSRNMSVLQKQFHDVDDVHFVSITVDPERDSPEVLEGYAKKYEANLQQWDFLTGTEEDIKKLSTEGFFIGSGDEMTNHSDKFVLVDREGNLRGFYTGTETEEVTRLAQDMQILLNE